MPSPTQPIAKQQLKQRLLSLPMLGGLIGLLLACKNSSVTQQRVAALEERVAALEERALLAERQALALEERTRDTEQRLFKQLAEQHQALLQQQAETLDGYQLNMARALATKQNTPPNTEPMPVQQPLPNDLNSLYIAFEDQFRGAKEDIRKQQEKYLPFLEATANTTTNNDSASLQVLDIGCGRGEWLRLLRDQGYQARGIDLSQTMVDFCQLDGLNAQQTEALTHLATLDDESLHIITAFHVIEHLSFEQLAELFDQCLRVLVPGGKIIFETPNPENLVVGAYSFYVDPTHISPLPPVTTEFIARQRGFNQTDIYRYNPREEVGELTELKQQWFCHPCDYALVAEK